MMIETRLFTILKVAGFALFCAVGTATLSGASIAQDAEPAQANQEEVASDGADEATSENLALDEQGEQGETLGLEGDVLVSEADEASEEIANPYGLSALWNQGDLVSRGALIILLLMSIGSWYIIFSKLFEQRRAFDQSKKVARLFAPTDTLKEGLDVLPVRNSFRHIAEEGYESAEQFRKGLSEEVTLTAWSDNALGRAIERMGQKLQSGLAFLATVGSTAPFVGLFGTVWGIYHALVAIGVSGQASIDKVAGPVGEALIMTAIGLAVAVPAVLGYNWLVRRNKAVLERARLFAEEVHLRIASGRTA